MSGIHEGPADESGVRDFLQAAAEPVHASDELFDRVRSGAARRRRRVRAAGGAFAIVAAGLCGTAVAVALPGPSASTPVGAPTPTAGPVLSCPAGPPTSAHLPAGRSGLDRTLVPGTPVSGVACVYHVQSVVFSGQVPTVTLLADRQLTGAELNSVVAALNQPLGHNYVPCPSNTGDQVYLEFHYNQGPDVAVEFTQYCTILTNGELSGTTVKFGVLPSALAALIPKATPPEGE